MMKKMQPISFTEEENTELQQQLGVQTEARTTPKSRDPLNYPVFENPVNKKVLVYVPNHIVQDEDGIDRLRMDKPLLHSVTVGKRYFSYRCISGLVNEAHGLTGDCPLCDGSEEPWDLANHIIKQKCKAQGYDSEDVDNSSVKSIRSDAYSDRDLKDAARYYTFPIVVLETVNDDGKTLVEDNGNLKYQIMWYNISERQWETTWAKALEAMEDEPTHPGGNFFLLNYCYTPKKGEPNKRDSAKNLAVAFRNIKNSEQLREFFDKETEGWTPAKAQETVINNAIYSVADLQEVADEALEKTRRLLALYDAESVPVTTDSAEGEGFKLEKKPEPTKEEEFIAADDTDLDQG